MDANAQRDYDNAVELVRQRQKRLRQAKSARQLVSRIMSRRGVAGIECAGEFEQAWESVVPELAKQTRLGAMRRGVLEVYVSGSAVLQHLTFEKDKLLESMRQKLPHASISDLRFRVGQIGD